MSVCLSNKEDRTYNVLVVEKRKGLYAIADRKSGISSEKELEAFLPNNAPVMMNIEGWGVLIKEARFGEDGELTGQPVPNPEDFEIYPFSQGKTGHVAIIRTETLQEIYSRVQPHIKDLVGVSAGPMVIGSLITTLGLEGDVTTGSYQLTVDRGVIQKIKSVSETGVSNYKFGDDTISGSYLSLLALCIDFFEGKSMQDALSNALLQEYSYKRLMIYTGVVVLAVLFVGLFVNYLFFDSYNKEYNRISGQYALNENILKQLKAAEADLKIKRQLVAKGGLQGQTAFAWYTDRLVQLMPSSLTLNRLSVHPELGKIQKGKEIQFTEKTILIEGETMDALAIHEWMSRLEKEEWVKQVDLVSYNQDEASEPAMFNLELEF